MYLVLHNDLHTVRDDLNGQPEPTKKVQMEEFNTFDNALEYVAKYGGYIVEALDSIGSRKDNSFMNSNKITKK